MMYCRGWDCTRVVVLVERLDVDELGVIDGIGCVSHPVVDTVDLLHHPVPLEHVEEHVAGPVRTPNQSGR